MSTASVFTPVDFEPCSETGAAFGFEKSSRGAERLVELTDGRGSVREAHHEARLRVAVLLLRLTGFVLMGDSW
ncbi:MAG: hypothetical protein SFW67_09970 [Myxococcaceae bacterium]|nr:hypothetical protein [Myxococcaceae bacterium]